MQGGTKGGQKPAGCDKRRPGAQKQVRRTPLTELNSNVAASVPSVLAEPQDQGVSQSQKQTVLPQTTAVTGTPCIFRHLLSPPPPRRPPPPPPPPPSPPPQHLPAIFARAVLLARALQSPDHVSLVAGKRDDEEEEEEDKEEEEKKEDDEEERTEREDAGWHIELVEEEEEEPLWVTLGLYSPNELNVGRYERASISSSSTLGLYSPGELSVGLDAGQGDGKF